MTQKKTIYSVMCEDCFEKDDFQKDLYKFSLYAATNRLNGQIGEVTEKALLDYIEGLFSVPHTEHVQMIAEEVRANRSSMCKLDVRVENGKDLVSKDISGFSDPFCMFAIVADSRFHNIRKEKYATKRTKFVKSTLNPVWNEYLKISLSREQVERSFLQIQVWDYDEENVISKKLKGIKNYNKDDFMGYNSVQLSKIPADGLYLDLDLNPVNKLQRVSGKVRVQLNLTAVKEISEMQQKYSDDLIYAGLFWKVLWESFDYFKDKLQNPSDNSIFWNASMKAPANVLLGEVKRQSGVPEAVIALLKWENYNYLPLPNAFRAKSDFVQKLLLELNRWHVFLQRRTTQFNGEMMISSIMKFVEKSCSNIAQDCEKLGLKMGNISNNDLKNKLQLMKSLFSMEMYQFVRIACPRLELDIRKSVLEALKKGTLQYYETLLQENLAKYQLQENGGLENDTPAPRQDMNVKGMISLCNQLQKNIKVSSREYHSLFSSVFKLDFIGCVCNVIHESLSPKIGELTKKVHKELNNQEDRNEQKQKISALFQLHLEINKLFYIEESLKNNKGASSNTHAAPKDFEKACPISQHKLQEWFLPVIYDWIAFCKAENKRIISRAVEMDKVKRVDNIVKHSTSAVDTVDWLATMMETWKAWHWPIVMDVYAIGLFLSRDLGEAVKTYINVIYETVRAVGFFDDKGQFDVTEELCVALNDLQYVKKFAADIPTMLDFHGLAEAISAEPNGPSKKVALFNLCQAIDESLSEIDRQINEITAEVGKKMTPDIFKWLREFCLFTEKRRTAPNTNMRDNSLLKDLNQIVAEAGRPLMEYLEENVKTFFEWLSQENFNIALEVLWHVCVRCLREVALVQNEKPDPSFYYQCCCLLQTLVEFFHEDGHGLSMDAIKNEDYESLNSELKLRSSTTLELIKSYYMNMYTDQQLALPSAFGVLNVMGHYEDNTETVHIDVISANDLIPMDMNGLSDPFVHIRLAPWLMFPDHDVQQTAVKKKTLDPLWEETFIFKVERHLVEETGAVIVFSILDYDRFGLNQLEGEAVLPLQNLIKKSNTEETTLFQMPLLAEKNNFSKKKTLPRIFDDINRRRSFPLLEEESRNFNTSIDGSTDTINSSSSSVTPLRLLQDRSYNDPDAAEFWKRKKLFKKLKN